MVVIAVFGRQRQKDHNFSLTWDYKEFKARLRHIVRPCPTPPKVNSNKSISRTPKRKIYNV
jgi:hypothetical protein